MENPLSEKEAVQIAEAMHQVMHEMSPERKRKLHSLLNNYLELMDELDRIDEEVNQRIRMNKNKNSHTEL